MKRHNQLISLAVLGALSAAAQAYDPKTTTFDTTIYLSGASAIDNFIFNRVDLDLCVNNANKSYLSQGNAKGTSGDYWGITCDSATPVATGKLLFLKRSAGGSGAGVGPVSTQTAIDFIDKNSCTDTDGNNVFTCPNLAAAVPSAGVSDVEPKMFEAEVNNGDGTPFNLETVQPVGLTFGIAVNLKFRNALQAAQFGSASPCVTSEDEKCMPSLTKEQLKTIFTSESARQNWSWLRINRDGTAGGNGEALNTSAVTSAYRPAPFSNLMRICRRVQGSGTQATFNAEILSAPCAEGSKGNLLDYRQAASNYLNGPVVWEGSGSSDVEKCLEAYDTATEITAKVRDTSKQATPNLPVPTVDIGINDNLADGVNDSQENDGQSNLSQYAWAVGILSVEKNPNLTKPYRYIKIDGVAPTGENIWNGKHWFFSEITCNFRPGDTSAAADFVRAACAVNPAEVAKLNLGSDLVYTPQGTALGEHSFGVAGYIVPSTSYCSTANAPVAPDGAVYNITEPVTNFVKKGNTCRDAVINKDCNSGRAPFNSGDTSLDTNGSIKALGDPNAGSLNPDPTKGSSW